MAPNLRSPKIPGVHPSGKLTEPETTSRRSKAVFQFITGQLARLPVRAYVSRLVAMATAGLSALIVAVALILSG